MLIKAVETNRSNIKNRNNIFRDFFEDRPLREHLRGKLHALRTRIYYLMYQFCLYDKQTLRKCNAYELYMK